MMDYGPHADTLYSIIIKETGDCWQMGHKDFWVKKNTSLGIRKEYKSPVDKPVVTYSLDTHKKRNSTGYFNGTVF